MSRACADVSFFTKYFSLTPRSVLKEHVFKFALVMALPNACFSALFTYWIHKGEELNTHSPDNSLYVNTSAFSSFTILIGLFVAFRASQAYNRFWEGTSACFQMAADFVDGASSLFAFTQVCSAPDGEVTRFHHTLVRLFSILHALILADLEAVGSITGNEASYSFRLIDPEGIDEISIRRLHTSNLKVDLVYHWIIGLLVQAQNAGILGVPAPICSRAFQELNNGMVQFHSALKIAEVPFPYPYTAATDMVLIVHWLLTPIVSAQWCNSAHMAFILAFIQVGSLWALNALALELENPFGGDANDLDVKSLHDDFNVRLLMLLENAPHSLPTLSDKASLEVNQRDSTCSSATANTLAELLRLYSSCESSGDQPYVIGNRRYSARHSGFGGQSTKRRTSGGDFSSVPMPLSSNVSAPLSDTDSIRLIEVMTAPASMVLTSPMGSHELTGRSRPSCRSRPHKMRRAMALEENVDRLANIMEKLTTRIERDSVEKRVNFFASEATMYTPRAREDTSSTGFDSQSAQVSPPFSGQREVPFGEGGPSHLHHLLDEDIVDADEGQIASLGVGAGNCNVCIPLCRHTEPLASGGLAKYIR